jgi:hypothetical protein
MGSVAKVAYRQSVVFRRLLEEVLARVMSRQELMGMQQLGKQLMARVPMRAQQVLNLKERALLELLVSVNCQAQELCSYSFCHGSLLLFVELRSTKWSISGDLSYIL